MPYRCTIFKYRSYDCNIEMKEVVCVVCVLCVLKADVKGVTPLPLFGSLSG